MDYGGNRGQQNNEWASPEEIAENFQAASGILHESFNRLWQMATQRNRQIDAFFVHLLAVCLADILERATEKFVEVGLPFEIQGQHVAHVAAVMEPRGFLLFVQKPDHGKTWVEARIGNNLKAGAPVTRIAIAVREPESRESSDDRLARRRVEDLRRELREAEGQLSSGKRRREGRPMDGDITTKLLRTSSKDGVFEPTSSILGG